MLPKDGGPMRRKAIVCILATVILIIAGYAESPAQAPIPGSSPFSPAPVGGLVQSTVYSGGSASSLEPYDVKITLLEVMRGEKAWDLIKEASVSNKPPKAGSEYILARIRFDYSASGVPGDKVWEISNEQFTALSSDGKLYETPSIVLPKPELSGSLRSGGSIEGWRVFQVPREDNKPLMTFDPASGGGMLRGKVIWFQL
jgi:hypothetical protein